MDWQSNPKVTIQQSTKMDFQSKSNPKKDWIFGFVQIHNPILPTSDDVSVRFDVHISLCSINECMSGVLNKSALPARPCPPPFLPMPPNKGLAAPWDVGNNYDCRGGRRRRRWGSVVRVRCHCLSVRCSVPRATYAHTSHAHGM